MKIKFFQVATLCTILTLGIGEIAQAGKFDLVIEQKIYAGQTFFATLQFTRDGVVIGSAVFEFINGTNQMVTERLIAKAPEGTNDRRYNGQVNPTFENFLPTGQVDNYGIFLATNGFNSLDSALDSFAVVGDLNLNGMVDNSDTSVFAIIDDLSAFIPVADESNFPLGSTLMTDTNGRILGLPGIGFFSDSNFTTPLANTQVVVTTIISEFDTRSVPESTSTLSLLALGTLGAASTLKRKLKPSKSTQKETTKVG